MTATPKLISPSARLVFDLLTELEQGGQDPIAYFKPHISDISRQKIAGWKRSGKVPQEAVDAVLAQSIERSPDETPPIVGASPEDIRPDLEFPPPTSTFETGAREGLIAGRGAGKKSGEGMTLPPVRPSGVAPRKSLHGPVVKQVRTSDARVSGLQTSARAEPEMEQEVSVQELVRAEVQNLKGELIGSIREMIGTAGVGTPTPNGIQRPSPRFRLKHWNEPQPAR